MKKEISLTILSFNFFLIDRLIKWFFSYFPEKEINLDSFLKFKISWNKDLAFSLPFPFDISLFSAIIIASLFYFLKKEKKLFFPLILIILGGLSNLLDRIFYNAVLDYLNLFNLSAFNLADLMIISGLILWAIFLFIK